MVMYVKESYVMLCLHVAIRLRSWLLVVLFNFFLSHGRHWLFDMYYKANCCLISNVECKFKQLVIQGFLPRPIPDKAKTLTLDPVNVFNLEDIEQATFNSNKQG